MFIKELDKIILTCKPDQFEVFSLSKRLFLGKRRYCNEGIFDLQVKYLRFHFLFVNQKNRVCQIYWVKSGHNDQESSYIQLIHTIDVKAEFKHVDWFGVTVSRGNEEGEEKRLKLVIVNESEITLQDISFIKKFPVDERIAKQR